VTGAATPSTADLPAGTAQRVDALRAAMAEEAVDLLAVAPSDNLRYALGFSPFADERACLLLVSEQGLAFVVPALNADQAAAAAPGLPAFRWQDEEGPLDALRDALASVNGDASKRVAVDPEMRADVLLTLQSFVAGADYRSAADLVGGLRAVKSDDELARLTASARTADAAMTAALAACKPGVSELEVAEAAAAAFREAGAQEVMFTIVGAGANGAFPHHHTSRRVLEEGDAVVVDIGGRLDGYASDITRMAFVGEPPDRYREVHAVVDAAVTAATAAAKPGVRGRDVDCAARAVIEEAGYGEFFVHRTGHGLGLSAHEAPWITSTSEDVLRERTVFSIEPGIYLPREFGVRLEEIVHLTSEGCARFSELPRDVHEA